MKKITSILATAISILALGFTSCGSTKQEAQPEKNTTFVNTKASADGKVYSVMIFRKLTDVTATHMRSNSHFSIPVSNCTYDEETTSIVINMPKEIPYSAKDLIFTVTGVPAFPGEFILCDGIYKRTDPGVFINGKKAVLGTDYTFDKSTNHLVFITPIDSDKDSYEIMWLTKTGTNAMSNNISRFESQYKFLEGQWFKGIK